MHRSNTMTGSKYTTRSRSRSISARCISPTISRFPVSFSFPPPRRFRRAATLLFWADNQALQGPLHLNFRLGASSEQIGLYDADARGNVPLDTVTFGPQQTDVSQGRCPDGSSNWQFFNPSTPGAMNEPCGAEVQACCLAGGVCDDLDSIVCADSGGLAQGSGSSCAATTCSECVADEDCDDGIVCTIDRCDMVSNTCDHTAFDSVCSDDIFCNGAEVCDLLAGCISGTPPCLAPEDCVEENDACLSEMIPSVSDWGMIAMLLLILTAGTLLMRRCPQVPVSDGPR